MTWIVLGSAAAIVATIAYFLREELRRAQAGEHGFAIVGPLRLVIAVLLMMAVILGAAGILYALPQPGAGTPPSPVLVAYWLFIALLVMVIFVLTGLDLFLVRRAFQLREDQALRDALLGQGSRAASAGGESAPGGESGT